MTDTKAHLRQHQIDDLYDSFNAEFDVDVRGLIAEFDRQGVELPGPAGVQRAQGQPRIFSVVAEAVKLHERK